LHRYEVDTVLVKWEVRTKKYARRADMPKRYTPVTAAADLEKALRLLEGRWKLVILFHLFGGKIMRFSDLERAIPAITQKMLGQQLKAMEAAGIVLRTAYPQVPPKVEYSLTSWGQSLCPALDAILKWADRRRAHVRKVSETRRPKDASLAARPRTARE
jgi:DNA-binding HxlR family transcriptional regulator